MVHTVPLTKLPVIKLHKNGEVITLKHETILKINLLENIFSENNILFVICCIAKLQGHKGVIKTMGFSLTPTIMSVTSDKVISGTIVMISTLQKLIYSHCRIMFILCFMPKRSI